MTNNESLKHFTKQFYKRFRSAGHGRLRSAIKAFRIAAWMVTASEAEANDLIKKLWDEANKP